MYTHNSIKTIFFVYPTIRGHLSFGTQTDPTDLESAVKEIGEGQLAEPLRTGLDQPTSGMLSR